MTPQCGAQRHQRLPAHQRGAAAEQDLDLIIVALGRGLAQIAVALEMEHAPVVVRIAFGLLVAQQHVRGGAVTAGLDLAQIGKEIGGAAQPVERIAAPVLGRGVETGLDVAPVLLDEPPQIGDQPLPDRAPSGRADSNAAPGRSRFCQPRGKRLVSEIPPDPGRLRRLEGEFFQALAMADLRYGRTRFAMGRA